MFTARYFIQLSRNWQTLSDITGPINIKYTPKII